MANSNTGGHGDEHGTAAVPSQIVGAINTPSSGLVDISNEVGSSDEASSTVSSSSAHEEKASNTDSQVYEHGSAAVPLQIGGAISSSSSSSAPSASEVDSNAEASNAVNQSLAHEEKAMVDREMDAEFLERWVTEYALCPVSVPTATGQLDGSIMAASSTDGHASKNNTMSVRSQMADAINSLHGGLVAAPNETGSDDALSAMSPSLAHRKKATFEQEMDVEFLQRWVAEYASCPTSVPTATGQLDGSVTDSSNTYDRVPNHNSVSVRSRIVDAINLLSGGLLRGPHRACSNEEASTAVSLSLAHGEESMVDLEVEVQYLQEWVAACEDEIARLKAENHTHSKERDGHDLVVHDLVLNNMELASHIDQLETWINTLSRRLLVQEQRRSCAQDCSIWSSCALM